MTFPKKKNTSPAREACLKKFLQAVVPKKLFVQRRKKIPADKYEF